jgi:hypothetical protein
MDSPPFASLRPTAPPTKDLQPLTQPHPSVVKTVMTALVAQPEQKAR